MSRQFSEDEARDIFARAAERQHATDTQGEGLTLAELQDIGRAAGLDPEHVAAAVAEAGQRPVTPAVVTGVNVTPRTSRLVPGEMTDPVWEQVVARLRQTFGAQGIATDVGRVREWTSGSGSNLMLTAEPAPGGTLVTIMTSREESGKGIIQLPIYGAVAAAMMATFLALGDFPSAYPWLIPALILGVTLLIALGIRQSLSSWSARRQGQFDGLGDQIELMMRADVTSAASSARDLSPVGRLGALDEPAPEADQARARRRTRE